MDNSHQLVLELLSLPDNILTNIIFPDSPIETLNKLCMLNVRFNNDILWESYNKRISSCCIYKIF
jgi:hypothetical protein